MTFSTLCIKHSKNHFITQPVLTRLLNIIILILVFVPIFILHTQSPDFKLLIYTTTLFLFASILLCYYIINFFCRNYALLHCSTYSTCCVEATVCFIRHWWLAKIKAAFLPVNWYTLPQEINYILLKKICCNDLYKITYLIHICTEFYSYATTNSSR